LLFSFLWFVVVVVLYESPAKMVFQFNKDMTLANAASSLARISSTSLEVTISGGATST